MGVVFLPIRLFFFWGGDFSGGGLLKLVAGRSGWNVSAGAGEMTYTTKITENVEKSAAKFAHIKQKQYLCTRFSPIAPSGRRKD